MARKVENCYGCPADGGATGCLLRYKRNIRYENMKGPKGLACITIYSPKECCHKPKTMKEFAKRVKGLY